MTANQLDLDNEIKLAELRKLQAETEFLEERARGNKLAADGMQRTTDSELASAAESRVFSFYNEITPQSAQLCMGMMGQWAREAEAKDQRDEEFTLEVCSPGGSVIHGFALIDYIRELQRRGFKINTYGFGWVASMGAFLFQVGDHRVLGRNSYLMLHEMQMYDLSGSVSDIEDANTLLKRFQDRTLDLLTERANLSRRQIANKLHRKEWWLDADEALKAGLCDEIR